MQPISTKRQKVALACGPCRKKKLKCDGRMPVCQPCARKVQMGMRCTWESTAASKRASIENHCVSESTPWSQSDAQSLSQDKNGVPISHPTFEDLHIQRSRAHQAQSAAPQPMTSLPAQSRLIRPPTQRGKYVANTAQQCPTDTYPQCDNTVSGTETSPTSSSTHAIIGNTVDAVSGDGIFGMSSAGTFMGIVRKMVQQKVGGAQLPDSQPQALPGPSTMQMKTLDYVLPSRRSADGLMDIYWTDVHVLYPFIDRKQLQDDYERIWKGSFSYERSLMCQLDAIFALCCQLDTTIPIEGREQLATRYYLRAWELLDVVESGSIRSVQTFLLLSQYAQSTNEPHLCWTYVGLAIRTAQSLGLNLTETSERTPDIRTRELLRRVWHGCVLMDRVCSMTYGRPCAIGPQAGVTVPLPSPVDEARLTFESAKSQNPREQLEQSGSILFFVSSLRLHEILHDVIHNFYSVNFNQNQPVDSDRYWGSPSEHRSSLFEIERRLSKWQRSLPESLKLKPKEDQCSTGEATNRRHAVVLHQMQLHVRLLLLRPVLSSFIPCEYHDAHHTVPLSEELSHRILLSCAVVCVKTALEAINTIHVEKANDVGETGSLAVWWYNVLYLYTSATVLIAARLSSEILAEISENTILNGWRQAIDALESFQGFSASIKRLVTTLRLLFEAVPQRYSRIMEVSQSTHSDLSSRPLNGHTSSVQPDWPSLVTVDAALQPLDEMQLQDSYGHLVANDFSLGSAMTFNPNDFSWLMTIPTDDWS